MGDIITSGGGVFTPGQLNVGDAELNAITTNAVIQTTFVSGKGSASANPDKANHYVLLLDSSGATPIYKKATLAAAIFDSAEFIQNRTIKATPVAADTILIGDSAAGGAPKTSTLVTILFSAVAHAAPIAADTIPIYNSAGSAISSITLGSLINLLAAHTAPVAGDKIMVREAGGAVRGLTLVNLLNGMVAETVPAAAMKVAITDGATVKNVTLATLISGIATSLVTPAGTELAQVNDAGTLKKLLLSDLKTYAQVGGTRAGISTSTPVACPAVGLTVSFSHGLNPNFPRYWKWVLVNTTPEAGFVLNDELDPAVYVDAGSGNPFANSFVMFADNTNIYFRHANTATGLTPGNWNVKCYYA